MRLPLCAVIVCAALVVAGGAAAVDDPFAAMLAPAGTCGPADEQLNLPDSTAQLVMTCLTNYARARNGLPPLQPNATLSAAGDSKLAADVSCGVFSHEPCGAPFDTVFQSYVKGATSYQLGENIAWGSGPLGSPRQIMSAWLHSTGHRENILAAAFTEIGIGYLPNQTFQGYPGASLWSQEFGTRTPASPDAASAPQTQSKPVVQKKPAKKKPKPHHRKRRHRHTR